jgi:exonuclease III
MVFCRMKKIVPRASGPTAKMHMGGSLKAPGFILGFITLFLSITVFTSDTIMNMEVQWPVPTTVSSINCNSLNMSSTGSFNHKLKLYGITKLRTDIILICDIRLSNSQNVPHIKQASTTFRTKPYGSYEFYSHSTRNKRGVGILIKKSANLLVLEELRDEEENTLILRVKHQGNDFEFFIGSIYGPNRVEPLFFESLRALLSNAGDSPIILGGDWNCTYSSEPPRINPDVCNMNNLPNKRHSDMLNDLCDDLALADPYRTRFPNKSEFSYIPSDPVKKNRSRIDFFIISRSILGSVTDIGIETGLQNKLFDHCAINLELKVKKRIITPPTISKKILKDSEVELVVGLAVADTYLLYSTELAPVVRENLLTGLGRAWRELREAGPSDNYAVPGDRTEQEELNREGLLASVREFLEFFPFEK